MGNGRKAFSSLFFTITIANALASSLHAEEARRLSLDPSRVAWNELNYEVSKLLFSAHSELRLETIGQHEAQQRLATPDGGPYTQPGNAGATHLTLTSRGLGQRSRVDFFLDHESGTALQRIQLEDAKKKRYKLSRFGRQGVHEHTQRPTEGERDLSWEQWTDITTTLVPFPSALAPETPICEPSGLLYIVSAAALSAPGDRLEIPCFSKRSVSLVEIVVAEKTQIKVNHTLRRGNRRNHIKGRRDVLRLALRARPLEGSEAGFQLLGLRGDVDIYLDPGNRVPVQVSGRVPYAGRVRFRLTEAALVN